MQPDPASRPDTATAVTHVLPGAHFDEFVAGTWLHVEEMGVGSDEPRDGRSRWWMTVAGAVLWVDVDREGRPTALSWSPPGVDAPAAEGCVFTEGG